MGSSSERPSGAGDMLNSIAEAYLAHPKSAYDPEALERWRPKASFLDALSRLSSLAPMARARQARVDGHEIHYLDLGPSAGEPVVLVHGFGANKENWLTLALLLRQRGYRLLIPDVPGFGQSSFLPKARYTYSAQARRLADWYAGLGLDPAHWVGSSMGGAICAVLAAEHPQRVASLTLMNAAGTAGARRSPLDHGLLSGQNFLIPETYSEVVQLFRLTTHRNQALWAGLVAPLLTRDMRHRAPVKRRLFHEMLNPEVPLVELLPRIRARTLVLWGDQDRIIDSCCADIFQRHIPRAQTKILRDIGHLPMLEAPRLTARVLGRFWATPEPLEV